MTTRWTLVAVCGCALPTFSAPAASPGWDFSGLGETHLIVGVPSGSGRGEVQIYHDSSPAPLRTIQSPAKRDFFGVATAGSGDLDGDGYDDVLIGAPLAGKGIRNHGMVYAYSGATGDQMLAIPGFGPTNYLGRAVAGAGDVNGDGIPDILASGWIHSDLGVAYGRVYVFCGLDGTLLKAVTSFEAGDGFGYTIASLGDLTGDGVPEIAIAAPSAQTGHLGQGAVYVFDLTTAPVTHLTTADATQIIVNDAPSRDYFGSVLAYDDQTSTPSFDVILIGSVDPISYGTSPAQFVFSRHKVGAPGSFGIQAVPALAGGDVIPDGKVNLSDVEAVTGALHQPAPGGVTNPDLDGDGMVTASDLVIVLSNYGIGSPLTTMLTDPSPLVTRLNQLTRAGGGVFIQPGPPKPWDEPPCEDDDDDDDGNDDGDDDDGPSVQPGYPGVRPPGRHPHPGHHYRAESEPPTTDDDCEEEGGGGEDGCSGCNAPDDDPDADCDAFSSIDAAKYVGRGLESEHFYANLTSDKWALTLAKDPESDIDAWVTDGPSTTNGVDYSASVTFEDAAGIAKLKWRATHSETGVVVTKCFSVSVVQYEPVRFQYRTFIPCGAVKTPRLAIGVPPYFGGDAERYGCTPNSSIFGAIPRPGQTHRSSCDIFIVSDGIISTATDITALSCDDDPLAYTTGELVDLGFQPRFGLTRAFNAAAIQPACDSTGVISPRCEYALIPGATPLANPAPASRTHVPIEWKRHYGSSGICQYQGLSQNDLADGTNGAYALRIEPNKVLVKYYLHASDPLIPLNLAPAIDVKDTTIELTWEVNHATGRQKIWWSIAGFIDRFPAHEAYLDDQSIATFDPLLSGNGLFQLTPLASYLRLDASGSFDK